MRFLESIVTQTFAQDRAGLQSWVPNLSSKYLQLILVGLTKPSSSLSSPYEYGVPGPTPQPSGAKKCFRHQVPQS